jgi:ribonuclease HI
MSGVVILADASFCPETRAAAWAAALMREGVLVQVWGGTVNAGCNNTAEFHALARAVELAIGEDRVERGEDVELVTDSHFVWHRMNGGLSKKQNYRLRRGLPVVPVRWVGNDGSPQARIRWAAARHAMTYSIRHVRGHTPHRRQRQDPVARTMAMLDQKARELMRSEQAARRAAWGQNT